MAPSRSPIVARQFYLYGGVKLDGQLRGVLSHAEPPLATPPPNTSKA